MATASGGSGPNSDIEGDILDVGDLLLECDEENWLVESGSEPAEAFSLALSPSNEAIFLSKKSLINKLDHIAKGKCYRCYQSKNGINVPAPKVF